MSATNSSGELQAPRPSRRRKSGCSSRPPPRTADSRRPRPVPPYGKRPSGHLQPRDPVAASPRRHEEQRHGQGMDAGANADGVDDRGRRTGPPASRRRGRKRGSRTRPRQSGLAFQRDSSDTLRNSCSTRTRPNSGRASASNSRKPVAASTGRQFRAERQRIATPSVTTIAATGTSKRQAALATLRDARRKQAQHEREPAAHSAAGRTPLVAKARRARCRQVSTTPAQPQAALARTARSEQHRGPALPGLQAPEADQAQGERRVRQSG